MRRIELATLPRWPMDRAAENPFPAYALLLNEYYKRKTKINKTRADKPLSR